MDALCNTDQNDVKNAVTAMKERNYTGRITQIGKQPYAKLEKDAGEPDDDGIKTCGGAAVNATSTGRKHNHVINRTTGLIHKANCKKVNRIKEERRLPAALVNVGATGLKTCKSCM